MIWPSPIKSDIEKILAAVKRIEHKLDRQELQIVSVQGQLDQILRVLIPPLPVGFGVTLEHISNPLPTKFAVTLTHTSEEMIMSKVMKASVDFQLLDNGTAKATATPVDSAGLSTTLPEGTSTPSWTSSDAGVVVSSDPSDASGLTAIITPSTPPVLVTGAVVTVSATLANGTVITGSGDPIDVVAGGPSGFQVVEQ